MKVPVCRVFSVGELTNWAKQFMNALQEAQLIDVTFETSVQRFCEGTTPNMAVVFLENAPDVHKAIIKIRKSGRNSLIVWYGKLFAKEDLMFAMENRVYWILEGPRADERKVIETVKRVARNAELFQNFEQHFHSVKSILLQGDENETLKPVLQEIRTALSKLERTGLTNEYLGEHVDQAQKAEEKLPFHQSQDLGDALMTVHDLERTGALWVRGALPNQEGKVEFLQGKIVAALSGDVRGMKAIYRMFLWDEPRFLFSRIDPQEYVFEDHLNISLKHFCEEAQDYRRRFEKIRRELPPAELRLELEPSALHAGTQLPPEDFSTLASVIEFGSVMEVVDFNPLPDAVLYESLIGLRKRNIIRVVATAE